MTAEKNDRFWIFILGGLMIVSILSMLLLNKSPVTQACIYQDGRLIKTLQLNEIDEYSTFTVSCDRGKNVIAVEKGSIYIIEADCPDNYCVRQGRIGSGLRPLVCLPHKLVIQLENAPSGSQLDAIVG